MNISRFFVYRPIFTVMFMLILLILGGVALIRLPIDLMPDITAPTISILTKYPNVSPEEMEELVTRPIEEAVSSVTGVEEVTSVSTEGSSQVRVTFTWGTDLNEATNDLRDRLDRIMARLPEDAERPVLRKFDLASFPILIMGAFGKLNPVELRELVEKQIKHRLERISGVASLEIMGGLSREIHINLYSNKIKALGLSLDQIIQKIKAENTNLPAGPIEQGNSEITIRTQGEYTSLDQLRATVIAVREGGPIRIDDIAEVKDSWQKVRQSIFVNGEPGIQLAIYKQAGTNTVEVATNALIEIDKINRDMPHIKLTPIIDTSDYIRRSITNVGSSAINGGILAVFILLFFLRSLWSTVIIATSIPISIVTTFALMYFNNFTLNIMTLGGLALGVGMLVDNSIVVLENIYRLREAGYSPKQAAIEGSAEVTPAIIASTLTTVVVFLPLIFVRGMVGVMFKQLAYVVSFSLLCSLGVSLTLVPMLSSRILQSDASKKRKKTSWGNRLYLWSGMLFIWMEDTYKELLQFSLRHRGLVLFSIFFLFVGSLALIPMLGVEMMPSTDEGEVRVNAEMEIGTRLDVLERTFQRIEEIVEKEVPEIKSRVTRLGGSPWRPSGTYIGEMRIALQPLAKRKRSSEEIAGILRRKLTQIPGVVIRTRAGQGLFLLRRVAGGSEKIEMEIRGYDMEIAEKLATTIQEIVEEVPGVTDVEVSQESGSPEEIIKIDRQKSADMKLTVSQIAGMLQTVLSGTQAGNYREGGDEYKILVKIKDSEKLTLPEILHLTLTNSDGEQVILKNVVTTTPTPGPGRITRKDQERISTLAVNISGRDMGSVIRDIQKRIRGVPRPQDFSIEFAGDYEEQQKSFRELALGLVLSLVLVYMVMACLYESLRDPFIVMFSVPLAAIGITITLFLTNTTFNIQSFIGCIMLGGIVVNNAILLVDYTNLLQLRDKMPMQEAIAEAGRRRLRPILMTALTTILGLIPLALGLGEGGEAQAPLARAVVGGLVSSTLITLLVIPVMYSFLGKIHRENEDSAKSHE